MAKTDVNGNLHGRDGRFIPKNSSDTPDEDLIIKIQDKHELVEVPLDSEHLLTNEEYSVVAQHLANLKRKYGDNYPDMSDGYPLILGNKYIIISGSFEEFTVDFKDELKHFLHYFDKEKDEI